jgi:dTDP-4-dehydrorhamnose 3,5-epimerase
VLWNDPAIGITWPDAGTLTLSPKDAQQPLLAAAELFD